ncbi:unnamed protein product [Caenorhabditis bovis]|uniref:Uncharacterized protein n=1 Tax=Caenorhabditis bovis TaxID=2654633 RepID=A0A8S1F9T4_9PELO|nr:unnamed protein product [Caenorhabditis bovis]
MRILELEADIRTRRKLANSSMTPTNVNQAKELCAVTEDKEYHGIIYATRIHNDEQLFEIFDHEHTYLHARIDEIFLGTGDLVLYNVRRSKEAIPGVEFEAYNVRAVPEDLKQHSEYYGSAYYDIQFNSVVFKTNLKIMKNANNMFYAHSEKFGEVFMESKDLRKLLDVGIYEFELIVTGKMYRGPRGVLLRTQRSYQPPNDNFRLVKGDNMR